MLSASLLIACITLHSFTFVSSTLSAVSHIRGRKWHWWWEWMPNILHLLHVPLALVALILASILHAETKLSDRLFHTASFGLLLMITVDFFLDVHFTFTSLASLHVDSERKIHIYLHVLLLLLVSYAISTIFFNRYTWIPFAFQIAVAICSLPFSASAYYASKKLMNSNQTNREWKMLLKYLVVLHIVRFLFQTLSLSLCASLLKEQEDKRYLPLSISAFLGYHLGSGKISAFQNTMRILLPYLPQSRNTKRQSDSTSESRTNSPISIEDFKHTSVAEPLEGGTLPLGRGSLPLNDGPPSPRETPPSPVELVDATAFPGFYAAVLILKFSKTDYNTALAEILFSHFQRLEHTERFLLYLAACMFNTNAIPPYGEFLTEFAWFVETSMQEPEKIQHLFTDMHARGVQQRLCVGQTPKDLEHAWSLLMTKCEVLVLDPQELMVALTSMGTIS